MFTVLCGQFNSSNTNAHHFTQQPPDAEDYHSHSGLHCHWAALNLGSSCQVMFLTHIPRIIFTPGSGGNAAVCPGVVAEYNYICGLAAKQQSQIKSACTKWTISNDLGQNVHFSHFFRFNNILFNTWIAFKKILIIKVLGGFWPAKYDDLSFPYSDTSFCLFNKLCKYFNQFSNSYQLQTLTSSSTRNIFQGSIFFCNSFIKTFPLLVTKFLQPPILLAATLNGKWTDNLIPNFSNQLP